MVKVLSHVMRNINEFNIPAGDTHGYEILYFGVNLIFMFDYRLSFDIEIIKNLDGSNSDKIEVLIINRKDVRHGKKVIIIVIIGIFICIIIVVEKESMIPLTH